MKKELSVIVVYIYTYLLFLSLLELSQFLAVPELSVLVPGLQNGATPGPVLANALLPLLVPPLSLLCRQHMWSCVTIPGGTRVVCTIFDVYAIFSWVTSPFSMTLCHCT